MTPSSNGRVNEGRRVAERPYDPTVLLGVLVPKVFMLGLSREWEIAESMSKTWKGNTTKFRGPMRH